MDFFYLTIAEQQILWPGLIVLGLSIGLITGLFGVGGGFLLAPSLNILFGIPFPLAVGTNLAQIFVAGSMATVKHHRRGNVDIRLGAIMATAASIGSLLGQQCMAYLKVHAGTVMLAGQEHALLPLIMKALFLFLMTVITISILRETKPKSDAGEDAGGAGDHEVTPGRISQGLRRLHVPPMLSFPKSGISQLSLWAPLMISFSVGIITGLMGVGGFVLFPLLVYVIGVPTAIAVGTGAFQLVFATGFGAVRAFWGGDVSFPIVGLLLAGSLVGVQLGVHASHRFGGRKIRKYFAGVICLGIAMIVFSLIHTFTR